MISCCACRQSRNFGSWFTTVDGSGRNEIKLETFLRDFDVLSFDDNAAIEFGRIKADLRKLGRPIPDMDAQIAAIARSRGVSLLTADKHFNAIAGITIHNWL